MIISQKLIKAIQKQYNKPTIENIPYYTTNELETLLTNQRKLGKQLIDCEVIKVIDGDTIHIRLRNEEKLIRVRLADIDAPETKESFGKEQPYGQEAKNTLELILKNEEVFIQPKNIDRDKERLNALVYTKTLELNKGASSSVNTFLLAIGLAWYEPKNSRTIYKGIAETAKKARIGLWKDKNPIKPKEFRESFF